MHRVASEIFSELGFTEEPMPDFAARFPGRLEACLGQPFAHYGRAILHRGLVAKAVAHLYYCTKNHPVENGNKRFAVTVMLYFLYKNDWWTDIDYVELYNVAREVAESPSRQSTEVMANLRKALGPHFYREHQPSRRSPA